MNNKLMNNEVEELNKEMPMIEQGPKVSGAKYVEDLYKGTEEVKEKFDNKKDNSSSGGFTLILILLLLVGGFFGGLEIRDRLMKKQREEAIKKEEKKRQEEEEREEEEEEKKFAKEDGITVTKGEIEDYLNNTSEYMKLMRAKATSDKYNIIITTPELPGDEIRIKTSSLDEISLVASKKSEKKLGIVKNIASDLHEFIGKRHGLSKKKLNTAFLSISKYEIFDGFIKKEINDKISYVIKTNVVFNIK